MHLRLDPGSGDPLGLQIVRQIRLAVATGRLQPGERLPSARDLARDLRVNFHTVRKAYAALRREGLLRVERGAGTYVESTGAGLDEETLRRHVRAGVRRMLEGLAGAHVESRVLRRILLEEIERVSPRQREKTDHA